MEVRKKKAILALTIFVPLNMFAIVRFFPAKHDVGIATMLHLTWPFR
jgi:hypothetical protein